MPHMRHANAAWGRREFHCTRPGALFWAAARGPRPPGGLVGADQARGGLAGREPYPQRLRGDAHPPAVERHEETGLADLGRSHAAGRSAAAPRPNAARRGRDLTDQLATPDEEQPATAARAWVRRPPC